MLPYIIAALLAGLVVGAAVGFLVTRLVGNSSLKRASEESKRILDDANRQAETVRREAVVEAKDEVLKMKQEAQAENKERMKEVRAAENRVNQREENLDKRIETLDQREHQLSSLQGQVERRQQDLDNALQDVQERLEAVAGMSPDEAKQELLEALKEQVTHESATIIREAEQRTKAEADKNARNILSIAIQRLASEHTAETTSRTVPIPSDDMKGRIIGREGRNIRAFEEITGVSIGIDDSPEAISISCHDPVRREIARVALENLIADGRIHPARIEEMFAKAERSIDQRIREAGEQAAYDVGIHDLHPEIINTMGRLKYRTSFSQNVLDQSIEVAHLCGMMASELGLDPAPAKRAGFLHDLGKAIDHEVEGPHAVIGADLARRYGEAPEIVHAIEAHHNDVEPNAVIDVLVQAADAVSASRPGARRESQEKYIKRLEQFEEIANKHKGVERTYAMHAGRELRVMVQPEHIDDAASVVLAHDIAAEIEETMKYPGQVKVVVIRESRAEGLAK
ncbi:MAG: ribonuclease Y [Eggerthellaceae bacterium]|nr:ribonuclease Y [Eggerthellaceae bacterium]